jgi:hypothetical protein
MMAPDFDFSNLPECEVEMWINLQAEAIIGQIMADQATRLGFPPAMAYSIASAMANKLPGIQKSI